MTADEQRWQAVLNRDAAADGSFVYGVVSTGVFCHPSCPSRRASRDNVRFFECCATARTAGFRACRRCRPEHGTPAARRAALVQRACRLLEGEGGESISRMAAALGVGTRALCRDFSTVTGMTPKQWQLARRRERLLSAPPSTGRICDAVFDAGHESATRFYADIREHIGMTPTELRRGGPDEPMRYALAHSTLGRLLVAWTARGLCAVELSSQDPAQGPAQDPGQGEDERLETSLQQRFSRARLIRDDTQGAALVQAVVSRVEEPEEAGLLPLDLRGTAFQQRVWNALLRIPVGDTASYAEVAELIGSPRSHRAVAAACAANPLAVIVPCHRVVRADGSLSGYRWGKERKAQLLQCERAAIDAGEPDKPCT